MGQWSDWKYPGDVTELDDGGDFSLSDYGKLVTYDVGYCTYFHTQIGSNYGGYYYAYQLYHNGADIGTEQVPNSWVSLYEPPYYTAYSFGSSNNTFGATLTGAIVNSSSFGLRFVIKKQEGVAPNLTYTYSKAIVCSIFAFSLPAQSTIHGIYYEFCGGAYDLVGDIRRVWFERFRIRAFYSYKTNGLALGTVF